jgi:cysteine desulfuration protein SufE
MTINEAQDTIIEEWSEIGDWFDKYNYLIKLGSHLPFQDDIKTDNNLISGCQSRVWLSFRMKDRGIYFSADSETAITKGIIALILRVVNGHSPGEIGNADLYLIDKTQLSSNLSPSRSNGLKLIVARIQAIAKENT